ncbi:hypothetical protein EVAR_2935_1 [Eumeta japonica]|uniref:Uncharacterized protein n=1 Tax=Eumeta variegata TaxID=151549 RepID=A0A4C1T3X2_EUMVA|nr:hypothetical protein EVAR_2935_1 [Eumeta japonica]
MNGLGCEVYGCWYNVKRRCIVSAPGNAFFKNRATDGLTAFNSFKDHNRSQSLTNANVREPGHKAKLIFHKRITKTSLVRPNSSVDILGNHPGCLLMSWIWSSTSVEDTNDWTGLILDRDVQLDPAALSGKFPSSSDHSVEGSYPIRIEKKETLDLIITICNIQKSNFGYWDIKLKRYWNSASASPVYPYLLALSLLEWTENRSRPYRTATARARRLRATSIKFQQAVVTL